MLTWLASLAPRDRRAEIALYASIGGTMALTLGVVGIVLILWRGGWSAGTELARIDKIGLIAVLVTIIMGVTMTSLGLAINRRVVKANIGSAGFEASGGDDPTAPIVAGAAAGAAAGASAAAATVAAAPPPEPKP
jgi:hypothetical protein